jgi:hypothetical protein
MKKQEYKLVAGTFNIDNAKEVLMSLINSKINFHNKKMLNSIECKGERDEHSQNRIAELNESRDQILRLLKQADIGNQHIRINSTIHIEIEE